MVPLPWIPRNFAYKHSITALLHTADERAVLIPRNCMDETTNGRRVSFLLSDGAPIKVIHNLLRTQRAAMESIAQDQGVGPSAYAEESIDFRKQTMSEVSDGSSSNQIDLMDECIINSREAMSVEGCPSVLDDRAGALDDEANNGPNRSMPVESELDVSSVQMVEADLRLLATGNVRGGAGGFHKYQNIELNARQMEKDVLMERSKVKRPTSGWGWTLCVCCELR